MSYNDDIKRLERELSEAKDKQFRLEGNCNHKWSEASYDPEIKKEPIYETRWQGVDSYGEIVGYNDKTIKRWSRICFVCGKKEYTYEQQAVKYEPKF